MNFSAVGSGRDGWATYGFGLSASRAKSGGTGSPKVLAAPLFLGGGKDLLCE